MARGRVLHARHGDVDVLRYEGDIRYPLAPSIEQFLDRILDEREGERLLVDLTATESIDSTNLGLLARTATRVRKLDGQRVGIVSHGDIEELLGSMGFHEVFDIVHDETPAATSEIPTVEPQAADLARIMLETHRSLMGLNERNRNEFRDIVTLLEQQRGTGYNCDHSR